MVRQQDQFHEVLLRRSRLGAALEEIGVTRSVSAAPKLGLAVGTTSTQRLNGSTTRTVEVHPRTSIRSTSQPTSTRQGVSSHDAE